MTRNPILHASVSPGALAVAALLAGVPGVTVEDSVPVAVRVAAPDLATRRSSISLAARILATHGSDWQTTGAPGQEILLVHGVATAELVRRAAPPAGQD